MISPRAMNVVDFVFHGLAAVALIIITQNNLVVLLIALAISFFNYYQGFTFYARRDAEMIRLSPPKRSTTENDDEQGKFDQGEIGVREQSVCAGTEPDQERGIYDARERQGQSVADDAQGTESNSKS